MPYLKITCPDLPAEKYAAIAQPLTNEVNDLYFNSKARVTREELRAKTTIHLAPYQNGELYVGAQTPAQLTLTPRTYFNIPVGKTAKKPGFLLRNGAGAAQTGDFTIPSRRLEAGVYF